MLDAPITFCPGTFTREHVERLLRSPQSAVLALSVEDEARDEHGRWTESGGESDLFEGRNAKPHTAADRAADVANDAAKIAATRHSARAETGAYATQHIDSRRDWRAVPKTLQEQQRATGAANRGGTIQQQEAGLGGTRSGRRQDQQEPDEKFPRERQRAKAAEFANSLTEHADAADYHDRMQRHVDDNSHLDDESHREAAESHHAAIKSLRAKGREVGGGLDSKAAREASKRAHTEPDPMNFGNLLSADLPWSKRLRISIDDPRLPLSQRLALDSREGGPPQTGSKGDWGIFRDIGGEPYFFKLDGGGKATMPANEVARLHKTIAKHEKDAKGHQNARDNAKVRGKTAEAKEHADAAQDHIDAATEGKAADKTVAAPKTAAEHRERSDEHYAAAEKAIQSGDTEGHAKHWAKGVEHSGKAKEAGEAKIPAKSPGKAAKPKAAAQNPAPAKDPDPKSRKQTKPKAKEGEWENFGEPAKPSEATPAKSGGSKSTRLPTHAENLKTGGYKEGEYTGKGYVEHAKEAERARGVGSEGVPSREVLRSATVDAMNKIHKQQLSGASTAGESGGDYVPIHQIRQEIANKYGANAASHTHLDQIIADIANKGEARNIGSTSGIGIENYDDKMANSLADNGGYYLNPTPKA